MEPISTLLFMALGAMVAVAVLKWEEIQSWMYGQSTTFGDIGMVIETELKSRRAVIVGGVFTDNGNIKYSKAWSPEQKDSELDSRLRRNNGIIEVTF